MKSLVLTIVVFIAAGVLLAVTGNDMNTAGWCVLGVLGAACQWIGETT